MMRFRCISTGNINREQLVNWCPNVSQFAIECHLFVQRTFDRDGGNVFVWSGTSRVMVRNRGAAAPWGAICNTEECRELIRFLLYHWKDIFKMSPKLNPNYYGFATRCQKLYFCFVGCRKPKKVGNHWSRDCPNFQWGMPVLTPPADTHPWESYFLPLTLQPWIASN